MIVSNAHRIVTGQLPGKGSRDSDFFMLESDGEACQQLVCDLVCRRLPQSYGFDPFEDIQVLCPSKIGPLGTVALNAALQQRLNPPAPGRPQLNIRDKILRVGDKVMRCATITTFRIPGPTAARRARARLTATWA